MVDKVNFNPFTGQDFTTEQIQELDTNNDGIISDSEIKKKWSWLSEQSKDADVEINTGFGGSYASIPKSAETQAELLQNLASVADEYMENYFTYNADLTDSERAAIQSLIEATSNSFITEYLSNNKTGPWQMSEVISEFEARLETEIANNQAAMASIKASLNGYEENTDSNLESMIYLAAEASANKNISNSEWNQVKSKTIQYLMGMLLKGDSNKELLSSINPSYVKDQNYQNALNLINSIKSANDPIEIQKLLTLAQSSLSEFLSAAGSEKTVEALNDYSLAQMEETLGNSLTAIADEYIEASTTANMSETEKSRLKAIVENCINKFISKVSESGTMTEYTEADLKAQFTDFINQEINTLGQAIITRSLSATDIESSYNELITVVDSANSNGNISNDEKTQIVDSAKNLIMSQLTAGMEDIPLLESLNPGYKESEDYKTLLDLISKIDNSIDADKMEEYQQQADELLTKILDSYSGDALVNGVNALKPIEISEASKDKIIFNSSISSDYQANVSRSTSRGKQNDDRLEEIQAMAKADLEAVAESLKAQLKSELGSAYNESDVQKYINDAMNDTIALFTKNVSRRNGHGNYNTGNDEQAFVFLRRSGTHKGRYVYNVQALVNTFIDNFNKTSKEKNAAKIDPSKATYDRENVLMDSLGNDYYRNKSEKIYGKNNDNNVYAQLIEKAKTQLQVVAASLKSSLLSEGVPVSMSVVDEIIEDCINETIEDMKAAFQYCQPSGKVSGGGITGMLAGAGGAAWLATGGSAVLASAGTALGASLAGTSTAAIGALTASETALLGTFTGASVATSSGIVSGSALATTSAISSAVPVVGWAVAGVTAALGALKQFTNLFGATYGKHNSDAGFYFERKSNSHSGNWGYDTQTLVDLFLAKFDAKLEEAKKNKEFKKDYDENAEQTTT